MKKGLNSDSGQKNIESVGFLFLLSKNAKIENTTGIISGTLTFWRGLYLFVVWAIGVAWIAVGYGLTPLFC